MLNVECTVVDMGTGTIKGKYLKNFDNIGNFNSWYKIVKLDYDTIVNIMFYNPHNRVSLKSVYDAKLLRVGRLYEN